MLQLPATPLFFREQLKRLDAAKGELEAALLTTTLRDAMNELKRYRKPSDTITVVRGLLGCKEPVETHVGL